MSTEPSRGLRKQKNTSLHSVPQGPNLSPPGGFLDEANKGCSSVLSVNCGEDSRYAYYWRSNETIA